MHQDLQLHFILNFNWSNLEKKYRYKSLVGLLAVQSVYDRTQRRLVVVLIGNEEVEEDCLIPFLKFIQMNKLCALLEL